VKEVEGGRIERERGIDKYTIGRQGYQEKEK
jgi:hypothetical protein